MSGTEGRVRLPPGHPPHPHLHIATNTAADGQPSPGAALACPFPLASAPASALTSPTSASPSPSSTSPSSAPSSLSTVSSARSTYLALRVGVTWRHMCSFFYASLITISAVVFMNAVQPYVFAQLLGVPDTTSQGALLSYTLLAQELTVVASASLWGLLSDKVGRRPVYVIGMALLALGTLLLAWARSLAVLLLVRVIFALGSAATLSMLTALLADYPAEDSRGKSGGVIGLTAGLGALLALFAFVQLPKYLGMAGLSASLSGTIMFAVVALVLALSSGGLAWGLAPHPPLAEHASLLDIVREGALAARNPRILLAYLAGFASRGDAVAITSFLSLWVSDDARINGGLLPAAALARAGMVAGIAQTLAIVGAPFIGVLADRIDRALCLTLSATWAMLAYALLFSLNSPDGALIYVAAVAVGLGEIFMIVSAQVLIASEAPRAVRGSVGGCFGLLGSASILATSFAGGFLYDSWRPSAPFALISLCNALVVIVGIGVLVHNSRQGRALCRPQRAEDPSDNEAIPEERKGLLVVPKSV